MPPVGIHSARLAQLADGLAKNSGRTANSGSLRLLPSTHHCFGSGIALSIDSFAAVHSLESTNSFWCIAISASSAQSPISPPSRMPSSGRRMVAGIRLVMLAMQTRVADATLRSHCSAVMARHARNGVPLAQKTTGMRVSMRRSHCSLGTSVAPLTEAANNTAKPAADAPANRPRRDILVMSSLLYPARTRLLGSRVFDVRRTIARTGPGSTLTPPFVSSPPCLPS